MAFTVPFNVTEPEVMPVPEPVVTVGANAAEAERLPSSFETKTSPLLTEVSYAPLVVGKLDDLVYPVTHTFPLASRVRDQPSS